MIISAINIFSPNRKKFNSNNTNTTAFLFNTHNINPATKDKFDHSKNSLIPFGLTIKEFPFDYETFEFIIPNKSLRKVKPNIEKIIQKIDIPTTDGLILKSWFIKPKEPNKPVFLFLNGTNSNKTHQEEVVKFFDKNGFGALMLEYRGFGENAGNATEQGLYEDATSALKFLNQQGFKDKDLILWGYSMGGAVARKIAQQNEFKCAILDSSIKNELAIKKHFLDTGIANTGNVSPRALAEFRTQFAKNENIPFNTTKEIEKLSYPILFMHSKGDNIVPYTMTEDQFKLSKNKNSKLVIEEGTNPHFYRNWTFPHITEFLDSLNNI